MMPEKGKDGPKARIDLEELGIRKDLHVTKKKKLDHETQETAVTSQKGTKTKEHIPPACFTLTPTELKQVFECLYDIKVTTGYSGSIRRFLDMKKHIFRGMSLMTVT